MSGDAPNSHAEEFRCAADVETVEDGGLDYWSSMLPDELKLKIVQHLELPNLMTLICASRSTREWILAAELEPFIHIDDRTLARFPGEVWAVKLVQFLNFDFVADRVESVSLTIHHKIPDELPDLERPLNKLVELSLQGNITLPILLDKFSKVSPKVQVFKVSPTFKEPMRQLSRECVEWIEGLPLTDFHFEWGGCREQFEFEAVLRSASLQRVFLRSLKIQQLSLLHLRNRAAESLEVNFVNVVNRVVNRRNLRTRFRSWMQAKSEEPLDAISKLEAGYHFLEVTNCSLYFPTLQLLCTKNVTHLHLALRRDEITDAEMVRLMEEATFQPRKLGLSIGKEIPVDVLRVVCQRFIDLEALALGDPCRGGFDGTRLERLKSLAVCSVAMCAVVERIAATCPPSLRLLHLVSCYEEEVGEIEAACDQLHGRLSQVAVKLRSLYYSEHLICYPRHWCTRGKMRSFCCEPCNVAWKPFSCCFQAVLPDVHCDHNGIWYYETVDDERRAGD